MSIRLIVLCVCSLIACCVGLFLFVWFLRSRRKEYELIESPAAKREVKTMDIILIIIGIALTLFTVEMIQIFKLTGTEPSTLEACVFAALGGECGVMGWIKTTKERNRDRIWQKEDAAQANAMDQPSGDEFPRNEM